MIGLSYTELKALKPCDASLKRVSKLLGGARKWGGKKIGAKHARKAGASLYDILWAASALARTDPNVKRRIRLWTADCAAHVVHLYEMSYPNDARPRNAIIASRAFAWGKITAAAWVASAKSAWAAMEDASGAGARGASAAATWGDSAWAAAGDAAWAASRAGTLPVAAWNAEERWQFDRLILWLSDPEPADVPLDAAMTGGNSTASST